MTTIYLILYYVWKFFAAIFFGDIFVQTQSVLAQHFVGNYYQLMQTPNPFQKTGLASATYFFDQQSKWNTHTPSNHRIQSPNTHNVSTNKSAVIHVINKEYKILNGKAVIDSIVTGHIKETTADPGTYFLSFDNMYTMGLYRILYYEAHPKFGTFMFVSSFSPKYSWLLWKPPLDKSTLVKAYEYGLSKIHLFEKIGVDKDEVIIVHPKHLYEMIELDTKL